jgi:hypothetical protein
MAGQAWGVFCLARITWARGPDGILAGVRRRVPDSGLQPGGGVTAPM